MKITKIQQKMMKDIKKQVKSEIVRKGEKYNRLSFLTNI